MLQRFSSFCFLVCLGTLVGSSPAWAEEENPVVKIVKAGVKDPAKPFTLVVLLTAKEGKEADLEAALKVSIAETLKEKGCLRYELNRDTTKPDRYMMYERWKSVAAIEAHMKTPYVMGLLGKLPDLIAGPPEFRVLLPAAE